MPRADSQYTSECPVVRYQDLPRFLERVSNVLQGWKDTYIIGAIGTPVKGRIIIVLQSVEDEWAALPLP